MTAPSLLYLLWLLWWRPDPALEADYDPYDWGRNGPGVVTEVLTESCGLRRLPLTASHCGHYIIYGRRRFYAIPWIDWSLLLEPAARDAVLERVDGSYVVHTWALFTRARRVPSGSAYHQLAEQHCPWSLQLSGADL
ncbi:lactosylceramide 4-alpha-galactosyltransferase-like [Pollicipes pollicipes]|uniref:lactosylceramide 4-alpha-galactosyltransferase-like n=1 Tax=Pollicipes pollicipes TaxID=41117 RepID=UPI0018851AAC|nr:lactosylceramide 4-alpha-galactosyltransferase-like [Pollicipes pollicipes]